jgi:hypothetical protein
VLALVPYGPALRSVGLLPPLWAVAVTCAAGVFVSIRWATFPAGLLLLPVIAAIPWFGVVPPGLLLWSGPCLLVVWALVILGGLRALTPPSGTSHRLFAWRDRAAAAGLLAAVLMAAYAWAIRPLGPSGDEPHYLLIATSVLHDGDLDLANDYSEDRHLSFYPGPLTPRHVVLGASGHEYSFHGHGVALLTLPALALAGVDAVRLTFLVISAFGIAALWAAARLTSASWPGPAMAVAALLCATPYMAQSSAIYPDAPGAAIVSLAALMTIRLERGVRPGAAWLAATGAALALLPWLHLRFSPLAATFGVAVLWLLRRAPDRASGAAVFLAAPIISATLLIASTWVMFDTLDPTAPFRQKASGSLAAAPTGILGLLADHEYGLLPYAPAFAFAAGGVMSLIRLVPVTAAAAILSVTATILTGASFVWWGGTSSPARFLVPILPLFGLCISTWWSRATSWPKTVGVAALALGTAVTIATAFAERGRFVINVPDARNSIFEWANASVDLPAALPSLFRPGTSTAHEALVAVLWVAVAAVVFLVLRRAKFPVPPDNSTLAAWGIVTWVTVSSSGAWLLRGINPVQQDRAQLALLQSSPRRWLTTGLASGTGVITPDDVVSRLRFAAPADDHLVLLAPRVPAGHYRVIVEDDGRNGATTFALELGRDAWPVETWTSREQAPEFNLALPIHSVRVVAATASRSRAVRLQVHGVNRSSSLPVAQRVTRYGPLDVYALDAAPAMETGGFWLPGNRRTPVVVTDRTGNAPSMVLALESSEPVSVRVSRGTWQDIRDIAASTRAELVVPAGETLAPIHIEVSGTNKRLAVWVTVATPSVAATALSQRATR